MSRLHRARTTKSVSIKSHHPSSGLTLMELVVVLSVLAAVAAIIAPLLPNLLRRAHKATDATQTSELSKAVQTYQAAYYSYPSNFDLLTDGTNFPSYLPNDGGAALTFGGFAQALPLTSDEAAALNRVGISSVQKLATSTTGANFHPTMSPYAGTIVTDALPVVLTTATFAVIASTNANLPTHFLQSARAADPTARYVVFGVGPRSSMVGTIIQDAPMSVPQKAGFTPANTYSRVGVIYKVSGVEVERTERARFIGAVALEDDELESTERGSHWLLRGFARAGTITIQPISSRPDRRSLVCHNLRRNRCSRRAPKGCRSLV